MRTRIALPIAVAALLAAATLQAQNDGLRSRAMPQYRVGLENLRAEQWDKAERAFQNAIEIDTSFEMAYYGLGRSFLPQKKYADAVVAFSKCRDLYQAQSGRQFANAHEAQRYRRDRILEIDENLRSLQTGPQSQRIQDQVRQLQTFRLTLQDAIQRGSNMTLEGAAIVPAFVSLSLGSAFFRLGRLPEAEREYKATVQADSKVGEAHQNLAVVYMTTGRYADAERAVRAAEKAGFRVNPQLKDELAAKRKSGSN
jgi:tetratricopeptide (TPR) repeat protein